MTGLSLMLLMKAYEKGSKVVGTVTKVCTSALWGRVIMALECTGSTETESPAKENCTTQWLPL